MGHQKIDLIFSYKWRRQWHPTPVLLPGKSHGQRSLVGCSPWGRQESDTTERLHFHFSLSYIGEGNGCPLQCSCLENPRDGGAWQAAVYESTQSRTRLKQFSSSSSSSNVTYAKIKLQKNYNEQNIKVFNKDMLQQGQDLGEVNEVSHKSIASAPVFIGNFNFLRSTFYLNTGDCTLNRRQMKDVG